MTHSDPGKEMGYNLIELSGNQCWVLSYNRLQSDTPNNVSPVYVSFAQKQVIVLFCDLTSRASGTVVIGFSCQSNKLISKTATKTPRSEQTTGHGHYLIY